MKKGLIIVLILGVVLLVGSTAWPDENSLRKAEELNQEVMRLYQQGRYAEAIPSAETALAIREKHLGPEHPDTAQSLNNLAGLYDLMGAYDKAEFLYRRSLAIKEKALGPEHPDTATSQPGYTSPCNGRLRQGGTPLKTFLGDQGEGLGAGTSRHRQIS